MVYPLDVSCKPLDFPGGSDGKESARNAGALGSNSGLGRSPALGVGDGQGSPMLQSMGSQNRTRLSN